MKKMRLVFSLVVGSFLVLRGGCSDSTSSTSVGTTFSKLSISGNRIVNAEGWEVRLRGVNTTDPLWLEKLDFKRHGVPDNRFAEITTDFARVKALGANIIRLPLYPGYYFLIGGEKYLRTDKCPARNSFGAGDVSGTEDVHIRSVQLKNILC